MSGLTNDDFRKLLSTPALLSRNATPKVADSPGDEGEREKKKKKFYKPRPNKKETAASAYRDRAAERREGKEEEVEEAAEAVRSMTAEESKFLGGDAEHTHLVRGLDEVLAEKRRAELREKERRREAVDRLGDSSEEKDEKKNEEEEEEEEERRGLGAELAARVAVLALGEKRGPSAAAAALFAPGKTAFVFDLDAERTVPATVMRSGVGGARKSAAGVPAALAEEISNILAYGAGGKSKRVVAASPAVESTPSTITMAAATKKRDVEKIFSSDEEEDEGEKRQKTSARPSGGYFGTAGDAKKEADPLASVLGVSAVKVEEAARAMAKKKQAEKARRDKEKEEAEKRVVSAPGAFGAYLGAAPLFAKKSGLAEEDAEAAEELREAARYVDDEEEEDDAEALKRFRARAELGEERIVKKKGKKKSAKMKMNQDMQKIEQIMAKKKDEGDE